MESRGYLSNKNGRNGSVEHISQLCRHIIKKDIIDTDPQLKSKIEDSIRTNLQSSISILNKAPSAQDDNTVNEFSAAENIKKYLVSKIVWYQPDLFWGGNRPLNVIYFCYHEHLYFRSGTAGKKIQLNFQSSICVCRKVV